MRPLTLADLEMVHDLELARDIAYTGGERYSLDNLRTRWVSPLFQLEDARLVFDTAGQLIAYLGLAQRQQAKNYADLTVRPGYSDPRLGDYLLAHGETWARGRIEQAPPEARVTLELEAYANDGYNCRACTRAGLVDIRHSWSMAIEMQEPPGKLAWPEGIELRPFVPGRDDRVTFDAIDTAFRDHWGYMPQDYNEWRHWTVERANFDPALWFLAYEGDQVAGCSVCFVKLAGFGWVDELCVLRPWRRKGLGLALLQHSFGEFYRRGIHKVGLGVDAQNLTGATRLYQRAGMYIAGEEIDYEKELRPGVEVTTRELPA